MSTIDRSFIVVVAEINVTR